MKTSAFTLSKIASSWWGRWLTLVTLALTLVLSGTLPVIAHGSGGTLQIDGAVLGPYTVMIWTSPSILRPGEVHVETIVLRGRSKVTDCQIAVTITPLDDLGHALRADAGAANAANEFRHEAAFQLDKPGRYDVVVSIRDAAARGGDVPFEMTIIRLPGFVQGFIYLQVVVVALAALWTVKMGVELIGAHANKHHHWRRK
ncbi:MAG: hypothetical protein R3E79_35285 [Caldilineaceae bacterium]